MGGWRAPQDAETRRRALREGAAPGCLPPAALDGCWGCFRDLAPARAGHDWLGKGCPGERDRAGQPLRRFLRPGPHRAFPTRMRGTLYLTRVGEGVGEGEGDVEAPDEEVMVGLLRAWFQPVEVRALALTGPQRASLDAALERSGSQIEAQSAVRALRGVMPRDAFALVGYSVEDLCDSSKGFEYLFGQADRDVMCGIFSFARYGAEGGAGPARFLRRCGQVLCHETMHLFGISHCVYAACVMNGSNHLAESDARPFAACPVDTWKLASAINAAGLGARGHAPLTVDLAKRQRDLCAWFEAHGLLEDLDVARAMLAALEADDGT